MAARVITTAEHTPPSWSMLWRRYAVARVALAAIGFGFCLARLDRDGHSWHDRASGTCLER
ncbi:hypothetical protein FUT69_10580 [Xylella taiwanensis]|uniref:Uncharacterized protein n=1 Tax=Xylella taiwanensis TaxID=1444770 RepID=Z9JG41_9GAMM|nr:hypothetical protein AF72_11395 [Xylella taiwanensis]NBI37565.1 hypothetical protein [Xylella taiwanensis]